MKEIIILTTTLLSSIAIFILTSPKPNTDEIKHLQLSQKQFRETFNQQMQEIHKKQNEIIKVYDLIISNRVAHIEK